MSGSIILEGLLGGAMIGSAAGTLLLLNGDIFGVSGILSNIVLDPKAQLTDPTKIYRPIVLCSFFLTVYYLSIMSPSSGSFNKTIDDINLPLLESRTLPIVSKFGQVVGGFCIGFGTRVANGCTTGHGVCGMARLSKRSIVAVMTFMAFAMLTVSLVTSKQSPVVKYLSSTAFGLITDIPSEFNDTLSFIVTTAITIFTLISCVITASSFKKQSVPSSESFSKVFGAVMAGSLFAMGLLKSNMVLPSKLYGFLNRIEDPALIFTLGGACGVSFLAYQFVNDWSLFADTVPKLQRPLFGNKFSMPTNKQIDFNLLFGSAIFGVGFGVCGLCPGPSLYLAAVGDARVIASHFPAFFVGATLAQQYKDGKMFKPKQT